MAPCPPLQSSPCTFWSGSSWLFRAGFAVASLVPLGGCAGRDRTADDPRPAIEVSMPDATITAEVHVAAGQLAESHGDVARALAQYRAAVALDGRDLTALYRCGMIYSDLKRHDEAIGAWAAYVEATNGSATAYANLGYALERAGRTADAETAYKRGIAADPADEPCRVNYGLMLARLGRTDAASAHLRVAMSEAYVAYNLASVHELQNRPGEAVAGYHAALRLDPTLADARKRLRVLEERANGVAVVP